MFIAALFTIAKTWKQPKCPLTDEWIKKMWYRDFPGGPVVKTALPMEGTRVRFLVRELYLACHN